MLTKLIKETLHWARRSVVRHIRSQPTNDAPKSMDDEERKQKILKYSNVIE
jgi:hypothetical protein